MGEQIATHPKAQAIHYLHKESKLKHGFCSKCGAWQGCLGLEPQPEMFVTHLVQIFREIRRVLRKDGTCWLNIGDSYAGGGIGHKSDINRTQSISKNARGGYKYSEQPNRNYIPGLKPKDLCLIPARVAIALQADGWWIRHQLPWLKKSQMPGSEKDRPTGSGSAVEYVFMLAKSAKYFYDNEAIKKPQTGTSHSKGTKLHPPIEDAGIGYKDWHKTTPNTILVGGRERRPSDWFFESWQGLYQEEDDEPLAFIVNPEGFKDAHFATFPTKLIAPMVLAGTAHKVCAECGKPWERVIGDKKIINIRGNSTKAGKKGLPSGTGWNKEPSAITSYKTLGFRPGCKCYEDTIPLTAPAVVLDPFMGSGTTAIVAKSYGRDYIGIEINPEYIKMAEQRIVAVNPQLNLEM